MNFLNNQLREINKEVLQNQFDLIVIGGGITGAGIALDAVTRGMSVLLLEMQDIAAGTSSRSTKLVHGGLRYLKNFEVKMVAEVGKEREIVYENGPHVTTPEWMLLPLYEKGSFGSFSTNIGLRVYDYLAGVKKDERRQMLSVEETLEKEPLLKKEGLKGSGYYVEYKTDDARLTLEVLKKAVEEGAAAFNYMKVEQLLYRDGKVIGVKANDLLSNTQYNVYGETVVNATGPWVDHIRSMDHTKHNKHLYHTKGVHVVFDQAKFPLQQAVYYDTSDGRMVFAIPREGKTYVGTTDTEFTEELSTPTITKDDRAYLLDTIRDMFQGLDLTEDDIESTWAGIRPLIHEEGKSPSEISRKDEVFVSDSGLISIAGGKLTGYRKMAEQIVDQVSDVLSNKTDRSFPESQTKHYPISGANVGGSKGFKAFKAIATNEGQDKGIPDEVLSQWIDRYGSNVHLLFNEYERVKVLEDELAPEIHSELLYSMMHELVYKPVDFFIRRTGALFFDIKWVEKYKEPVVKKMSEFFEWNDEETDIYYKELDIAIKQAKEPTPQA
ncbi:glycerol-3-phosphate dehydrogenase/oxidase [Filobacillus milosensis]|uniref:Glycerol-3-phosphate dehydrogenase n=1 Tax=Filobacillus milosensis TaxID=94137 RepID=A0A4Y8ITU5_9BACI|nr:glycerol-3-phosphate dehydrogenase/oxidase [Filobacillus milosensis]TFB24346.1 glycerol-3-phosphate dehydrogenase/oxidase [Filobacillus milosensis]